MNLIIQRAKLKSYRCGKPWLPGLLEFMGILRSKHKAAKCWVSKQLPLSSISNVQPPHTGGGQTRAHIDSQLDPTLLFLATLSLKKGFYFPCLKLSVHSTSVTWADAVLKWQRDFSFRRGRWAMSPGAEYSKCNSPGLVYNYSELFWWALTFTSHRLLVQMPNSISPWLYPYSQILFGRLPLIPCTTT